MDGKKYDVVALGELLIDFTQNGVSPQGNRLFEANPGGAPGNVLAMLSKLGHSTALISKVGNDQFGSILKETMQEVNIGSEYVAIDDNVPTTLAFVHTLDGGDRDFSFYRNPGADMMLTPDDIKEEVIKATAAFHFGTLSMTHQQSREATKKAIRLAKKEKVLITFDPNLRPPLWESLDKAKEQILYGLRHCDIVKLSDEELTFVTGLLDIQEAVESIRDQYKIPLILVTKGPSGSVAFYKDLQVEQQAYLQSATIETTGAGDTFFASVIHYVLVHGLENFSEGIIAEMLIFANTAASLVTMKKGALRVMPSNEEVVDTLNEQK